MGLKFSLLAGSTVVLVAIGLPAQAATDPYDGSWHFSVTPYLWLPAMSGSVDTDTPGRPGPNGEPRQIKVSGDVNPDSYLSNLQMAFMLNALARKGPWSIGTDIIYTDFGDQDTKLRTIAGPEGRFSTEFARNAKVDISATIWTLAGGYTVVREPTWNMDLIGGFRYLTMDSSLNLSRQDTTGQYVGARKVSMDGDAWDGIVGARGQILIRDTPWFVPYYADIGTGSSNWTWQAMLGLGYHFNWGEATLAWRAIGYEFDDDNVDLTLNGPALGVTFNW